MTLAVRNRLVLGVALFLLAAILVTVLATRAGEAQGSVLSRSSNGWVVARRYLEALGVRVTLLDGPVGGFKGEGVLVVSFPWEGRPDVDAGDALDEHLRRGGDVVIGYSGQGTDPSERVVLERLGVPLEELRKAELNPLRWRRFARLEWDLAPTGDLALGGAVRVWAPRWVPELPKEAQVLLRSPEGPPVGAVVKRHRGRIWLLPANAFANSRLAQGGNADLLESLRVRLGDHWTFDEYHHGYSGRRAVEASGIGRTLDLILVHLAVLYVVALHTLSRRFGPPWSEPPVVTGSAGSFLLGLGVLHDRAGHHAEAARRLLDRTRELDRHLELPPDLDARAATAGPRELVELAREVARLRKSRPAAKTQEIQENLRETAA